MPKETLVRLVLDRLWLKLADITGSKTVRDKKTSDIPAFSGRDYFPPINVTSLSYTRFDRYRDYEDMDANSPYIHTALDIYASDCCQWDAFVGATAWASSDDPKLAKILNCFLQETMEVEEVAESDCRAIAKYGSIKTRYIFKKGKGIVKVKPIEDDIYVLRVEDEDGVLKGFVRNNPVGGDASYPTHPYKQGHIDFQFYEIGHARLKDRPYVKTVNQRLSPLLYDIPLEGMSMIESARKPVKDYELLREALMVYRITHSIDRMEHKIDLTGKAPDEGLDFMQKYMNALKRKEYIDKQTHRISLLANLPSFMEDLFSPTWKDNLTSSQLLKITGDVSGIEDLRLLQEEIEGALKFPPGFLFRNEGASIQFNRHLSQENIILAKYIEKLQKAYRQYLFKTCQIHLALQGLPYQIGKFSIHMSPVSHAIDVQKTEILTNLITNAANLFPFAETLGIDKNLWNKYVMRMTLGRLDFGEVAAAIGSHQAQQATTLILKAREHVLDRDPSLRQKLPSDLYAALEEFRKLLSEKDFNDFAQQVGRFVEHTLANPYSNSSMIFNKIINKELYEFQAALESELPTILQRLDDTTHTPPRPSPHYPFLEDDNWKF